MPKNKKKTKRQSTIHCNHKGYAYCTRRVGHVSHVISNIDPSYLSLINLPPTVKHETTPCKIKDIKKKFAPGTYRFLDDNENNCKNVKKDITADSVLTCDPVDGTCMCESCHVECNKEGDEADSTTISCIIYYTNKLRVKLTPASVVFDPDNHDEYGFDDGHYCSIRESAMIRPLNQGHASLYLKDGPEDDKYNHLNPKIERKITDVYLNNGNIYTKIQNVQSGKQTTVTLPNYDRMELNKDQH
ncbi:unnamed protein product [Mytilus edulis]|uniref:Uncharacterized protein n=1 Tax=Mytilus edulis TaxID=6550 RepID=A0A8S3UA69_MYTED|nr:unnamed protein product [Mytilus edulis]